MKKKTYKQGFDIMRKLWAQDCWNTDAIANARDGERVKGWMGVDEGWIYPR